MSNLEIKKFVLGMVSTNCYVVTNKDTKEALIIDPADNADKIIEYIRNNSLDCKAILLTHGHFDHIMAASSLAHELGVEIYSHGEEKELLGDSTMNLSAHMGRCQVVLNPDVLCQDEEELQLAHFMIRVLYTPGHTRGGVCYYFEQEKILFSGDTLFMESVGRSDFPGGNQATLLHSIKTKLFVLEDNVKVYSGHGPSTSIGYEKENNPYMNESSFWS